MIEGMPLWVAGTNAWIVSAQGPGGECVLIDAPPDPAAIIERLHHHGLRVVAIFGTHGHVDHIGGMGTVARQAPGAADLERGIPVHIHDDDKHMLLDPIGTSGGFGSMMDSSLDLRPPEIIEPLDDGTVVKGAGMTFKTLHTPGHTMGSVCLTLDFEDGGVPPILFSGDHLFQGSIGRTDLPGGSFDALMHSMAEKILPLDDETAVLPGHGPTTTIGRERLTNPFILELLS
jgi:glyoxylase-like metal-dependent hydrolase (beta-lactamase superfamily II)